ncbi:MAG: GNAT family N-acetyltransferase [Actinomycetales bacterium]|nr:GNAT family N-acetyltransferase [Actinomycetales bacterium]
MTAAPPLRVQQLATARAWLTATESLRGADPVLLNVPGSVAEAVDAGARYDRELWLTVVAGDDVIGCAMRTSPWPAYVGPMPDEAAHLVGHWLLEHGGPLPGLTGPVTTVAAVAAGMGCSWTVRMRETVRVLDALREPAWCHGSLRLAAQADLPLLLRWFEDFHREADLAVAPREEQVVTAVREERLWLWADGTPVAMGGHARVVTTPGGTVGRIGPIYTVPVARRKGYGSALTHAIATRLTSCCDTVMLFADAENPTSNGIYERLGFEAVTEVVEAELDTSSGHRP